LNKEEELEYYKSFGTLKKSIKEKKYRSAEHTCAGLHLPDIMISVLIILEITF